MKHVRHVALITETESQKQVLLWIIRMQFMKCFSINFSRHNTDIRLLVYNSHFVASYSSTFESIQVLILGNNKR
jgi:hypothetical protein